MMSERSLGESESTNSYSSGEWRHSGDRSSAYFLNHLKDDVNEEILGAGAVCVPV